MKRIYERAEAARNTEQCGKISAKDRGKDEEPMPLKSASNPTTPRSVWPLFSDVTSDRDPKLSTRQGFMPYQKKVCYVGGWRLIFTSCFCLLNSWLGYY